MSYAFVRGLALAPKISILKVIFVLTIHFGRSTLDSALRSRVRAACTFATTLEREGRGMTSEGDKILCTILRILRICVADSRIFSASLHAY